MHPSTPGVRAAPSHPPTQPVQPLLPINGVTSPCGYGLFFDTRIDQPMAHALWLQLQEPRCSAAASCEQAASEGRCSLQRALCVCAHVCVHVFPPVGYTAYTDAGLPGPYETPKGKCNCESLLSTSVTIVEAHCMEAHFCQDFFKVINYDKKTKKKNQTTC